MSGVRIGDRHTEKDWGLLWNDVSIGAPEIQSNFVNVPYRNGLLDLSESLGCGVHYKNRVISLSFVLQDKDMRLWQQRYSEIMSYCHGKSMRIVFDSDPFYYYLGRIDILSEKASALHSSFQITIQAQPFRYPNASTIEHWLWDSFCFLSDVIRDYGYIDVIGSAQIVLISGYESEVPIFHCSHDVTLELSNKRYDLKAGKNKLYDIVIEHHQEYDLHFTGNATVSIEFKAGEF